MALGYAEGDSFKTEGWWSVGANRCSDLVKKPLSDRYYYIYAEDVFGQPVLVGDVKACVDSRKFLVTDTTDCWTRGFRQANFSEVDTQSQDSWTVFIERRISHGSFWNLLYSASQKGLFGRAHPAAGNLASAHCLRKYPELQH